MALAVGSPSDGAGTINVAARRLPQRDAFLNGPIVLSVINIVIYLLIAKLSSILRKSGLYVFSSSAFVGIVSE